MPDSCPFPTRSWQLCSGVQVIVPPGPRAWTGSCRPALGSHTGAKPGRTRSEPPFTAPVAPKQGQDWGGWRWGGDGATSRAERSSLAPRSHGPQSSWPQSRVPGGVWSSSETRTRHGRSEASLLSTCTPSWHPRVSPRESRLSYQCRSCCWGRCRRQRRSRGPRAQKTETRGRAVLGVHEAALGSGDKPGAQNGDNHCRVCRAHL